MRHLLLVIAFLSGCGDDLTGGTEGDGPGDGDHDEVVVTELVERDDVIIHVEDLGEGRLGLVTDVMARTDTICPDCEEMDIPDDECPAECSRERLEWAVVNPAGTKVVGPVPLRTFVLPWGSTYLGFVQTVRLTGGDVGVAWSLCEGPPARSCRAEYARFTEAGEPVAGPVELYDGFYGELSMAAAGDTVAIARSSDLVVRAGVWAAVVTGDGEVLRPFTRIGSSTARAAALIADGDGFVLVSEERQPGADDSACPPCERLDTCIDARPECSYGMRIADDAGLWAFRFGATGEVAAERVLTGWYDDGLYHPHQVYGIGRGEGGLAVASWWSVDGEPIVVTRLGEGEMAASAPLDSFGVKTPARWLGVLGGDRDELVLVGEAIAGEADGVQPHAFIAASLAGDALVEPRRIGDPFHGHSFAPTGTFGARAAHVAGGIVTDNPSAYDHWSVFRFEVAEP